MVGRHLAQGVELLPPAPERGKTEQQRLVRKGFREAFEALGGTDFLVQFATSSPENARTFVQCLSKLMPTELQEAAADTGVQVVIQKVVSERVVR